MKTIEYHKAEVGDIVHIKTDEGYKLCEIRSISCSWGVDVLLIGGRTTPEYTTRYRKNLRCEGGEWWDD